MPRGYVSLFLALCALYVAKRCVEAKKGIREWDNVDWDALEEAWEDGDEAEELESEREALRRSVEKQLEKEAAKHEAVARSAQRKLASQMRDNDGAPNPNVLTMDELQALSKQSKLEKFKGGEKFGGSGFTGADGLGGEMMFVHLDTSEDQEYSKQEIDVYLRQWKELLQTGGITAQVYNIGSATTLVTVPGYQSQQAKDFLLSRPEVVKVRFDNQDYHKDEL